MPEVSMFTSIRDTVRSLLRKMSEHRVSYFISHLVLSFGLVVGAEAWFIKAADDACVLAASWVQALPAARGTECVGAVTRGDPPRPNLVSQTTDDQDVALTVPKRIEQLRQAAHGYAEHHITVVQYFYSRYHAATTVALGMAVLVGLALLLVSKGGWDKANRYVLNALVVTTGLSVFYGAFPSVFEVQKNINSNTERYIQYTRLENELRTFMATGGSDGLDEKARREALNRFTTRLNDLNGILVGIDYTSIPNFGNALEQKLPEK